MKIIILAGGSGTRLWPWSRDNQPKQILPLLGKDTLLQQTYQRARLAFLPQDILVVTGKKYETTIKKQLPSLPKDNLLLEPVRRDSAGAIGLAAALISSVNEKEIIISVHADQWVSDNQAAVKIIKTAAKLISRSPFETVIVGVKPTYPETGYGYICLDKKVVQDNLGAHLVKSFKEKPTLARAKKFLQSNNYLWNTGWFAWRADYLLSLYKKYLPENFAILNRLSQAPKKELQRVINKEFPKLKSIPIDKGIIEPTNHRWALELKTGWTDIGHWRSVYEMSAKDKNNNVAPTTSLLVDSRDNLFWVGSKKAIASLGVHDLILVETPDVILVADKSRVQDIKHLVAELKNSESLKKYL